MRTQHAVFIMHVQVYHHISIVVGVVACSLHSFMNIVFHFPWYPALLRIPLYTSAV